MSASVSTTAASTVSGITEATGTGTRSTGRTRPNRRNRGSAARAGSARSAPTTNRQPRVSNFKGSTSEMNGNVFECFEEQGDRHQYAKTVEALQGYMQKSMKYSEDLAPLFAPTMALPTIELPVDPGEKPTRIQEAVWNGEMAEYVKRVRALTGNLATGMVVIWGQCSEAMKSKISSNPLYDEKWRVHDCEWLLSETRAITLQFDEKKNPFVSLLEAKAAYLNCRRHTSTSRR